MLLSIQGAPRLDVWPKAPLWAVDCWAHSSFLTAPSAQGKGMDFFLPVSPHRKPKDYPTTARACFKTKIFLKIKQRGDLFNII